MKPGLQTLLVSFAVVSVDRDKVSSVGEISLPLCNKNLSLFRFEMEFFFKKAFSIRFHDPSKSIEHDSISKISRI